MQIRGAHLAGLIRHPLEQTVAFAYFDDLRLRLNGLPLDRRIGFDRLHPAAICLPGRFAKLNRTAEMRRRSDHSADAVEPIYGRVDEAVIRIDALIAVDGVVFVEHPLPSEGDGDWF